MVLNNTRQLVLACLLAWHRTPLFLLILILNIYTLWHLPLLLLSVNYICTNLSYAFLAHFHWS